MSFDTSLLDKYPDEPGVYLMKDHQKRILYIGKAKNIKNRLRQYFTKTSDTREMIPYLISQVKVIDTIVVLSEKEALLLENNLIKQHKPKYNVLLKDDKTYVSLVMTNHKWPLLKLIRYKDKPTIKGKYFGPYTNAKAARQTLDLILRLFPLRQCSDIELVSRKRPCLLYDIKKCIAPCVNKCSQTEYLDLVNSAKKVLLGKDKEVLKKLNTEMQKASDALEFEKADEIYQAIKQIEHVLEIQHVQNPIAKDIDVIGFYREADHIVIVVLLFREGRLISSEHFTFHQILDNDDDVVSQYLLQHYQKNKIPTEILLPIKIEDQKLLEELLSEYKNQKIRISTPTKGNKYDLIEIAMKNSYAIFNREKDLKSLKEKMLLNLQDTLKLERFPRKIECFDTSNISGSDPVAAMVTFVNGEKEKQTTKLFKIKSKADDYSAMYEVIKRHYLKQKENNDFCDLLIVDGGKGQLNIALKVFDELNIASVDVIAVAKQDAKHTKGMTEEKVFLPHKNEPIFINPRSSILALLQRIRDEVHRVAINYHRKLRSKRTIKTSLQTIPGIGEIKRRRLLQEFKSLKKVLQSTDEELKAVKGITKKDISNIRAVIKD
jgi:excinuclease ABC subunit C